MPQCVVCDFGPADWLGEVQFADYTTEWRLPTSWDGHPIIGWSSELGITAPDAAKRAEIVWQRIRQRIAVIDLPAANQTGLPDHFVGPAT
jgi:hypothetical protein